MNKHPEHSHLPVKKIGIIGGSFDPIHYAHLAIAQITCDYCNLEKVIFIPAYNPPHKNNSLRSSAVDRSAMVNMGIAGNSSFTMWSGEIDRGGISYTIDTIHALEKENSGAEFYFIIGSDNLTEIPSWYRYKEIIKHVILCITERPGFLEPIPAELENARIITIPSPNLGISSTLIRTLCSKRISCRYLVPDPVLEYIEEKKLYTPTDLPETAF